MARLLLVLVAALASLIVPLAARPAGAQAGDFAPGAAFSWTLAGVRAEVALVLLVPPDLLAGRLPAGFRPRTLRMFAAQSPGARALLAKHAAHADDVLSILAIGRLDSLAVAGAAPRPATFAYWSVIGRAGDSARALDPRARAEAEVELGSWTSDTALARRLRAVAPTAVGTGAPTATRAPDGTWRLRLATGDATVELTCRPLGAPEPLDATPTVVMGTHWLPGAGTPPAFTVIASEGSAEQACGGASWRATGVGRLAQAIRRGVVLRTMDQTGWRARIAAYRAR